MNNVADVIDETREASVKHLGKSEQPLRECVRTALKNYIDQLGGDLPFGFMYEMVLEQVQLPLLELVMEVTAGNQSKAARLLGLSRGTFRKLLKRYDML